MTENINNTAVAKAWQTFPILVKLANQRQTITYKELNKLIGYKDGIYSGLGGQVLAHIQRYCYVNELPPITALVVNSSTGAPGEGSIAINNEKGNKDYENVFKQFEEIFNFDWTENYPEDFSNPLCFNAYNKLNALDE